MQEAEAGGLLQVQGWPQPLNKTLSETPSQNKNIKWAVDRAQ